jgi:ribosomal-protein-alanine N-acetyltransferase
MSPAVELRAACAADLPTIARIQQASPEAAAWSPDSYLLHECLVGVVGDEVAGFLAFRSVAGDEFELLNLAVAPCFRRRGVASALLDRLLSRCPGAIYLELRAANLAARGLYEKKGFHLSGVRPKYYHDPPEDGIVMRFQKC